jgi:hypothetical protein
MELLKVFIRQNSFQTDGRFYSVLSTEWTFSKSFP